MKVTYKMMNPITEKRKVLLNKCRDEYMEEMGHNTMTTLPPDDQIWACWAWMETQSPVKAVKYYSYGVKHRVEEWAQSYILNDAAIVAASMLGLDQKVDRNNSVNRFFNISFSLVLPTTMKLDGLFMREARYGKASESTLFNKYKKKELDNGRHISIKEAIEAKLLWD